MQWQQCNGNNAMPGNLLGHIFSTPGTHASKLDLVGARLLDNEELMAWTLDFLADMNAPLDQIAFIFRLILFREGLSDFLLLATFDYDRLICVAEQRLGEIDVVAGASKYLRYPDGVQ
jgi:hypothetical protein